MEQLYNMLCLCDVYDINKGNTYFNCTLYMAAFYGVPWDVASNKKTTTQ